jgi:hypothetical protein
MEGIQVPAGFASDRAVTPAIAPGGIAWALEREDGWGKGYKALPIATGEDVTTLQQSVCTCTHFSDRLATSSLLIDPHPQQG